MSADFSRVFAHLAQGLQDHADRDGLVGIQRAIFIDRGGHASGEVCPTAASAKSEHHYLCQYPDDECTCHLFGGAA